MLQRTAATQCCTQYGQRHIGPLRCEDVERLIRLCQRHFHIRFVASDSSFSHYNRASASVFNVECFNMLCVVVGSVCVVVYVLGVVCWRWAVWGSGLCVEWVI